MAESRGASIVETPYLIGDERYIEVDGKTYLRGCVEYKYQIDDEGDRVSGNPLDTAQTDLKEAWQSYVKRNQLDGAPMHLKYATGQCPEHVRAMLEEIVNELPTCT